MAHNTTSLFVSAVSTGECVNWFGNNLDWRVIPYTQVGNTPWGLVPHCSKAAVEPYGAHHCAVRDAVGIRRCPGDCKDGMCVKPGVFAGQICIFRSGRRSVVQLFGIRETEGAEWLPSVACVQPVTLTLPLGSAQPLLATRKGSHLCERRRPHAEAPHWGQTEEQPERTF